MSWLWSNKILCSSHSITAIGTTTIIHNDSGRMRFSYVIVALTLVAGVSWLSPLSERLDCQAFSAWASFPYGVGVVRGRHVGGVKLFIVRTYFYERSSQDFRKDYGDKELT